MEILRTNEDKAVRADTAKLDAPAEHGTVMRMV